MTLTTPSSKIGKQVLLGFVQDVQGNKKKDIVAKSYIYLGEQLRTVSLADIKTSVSTMELIENLGKPTENDNTSPYNAILGYAGFTKEELIQIRDGLVAPFVSDVYAGSSDNEQLNELVVHIIGKDPSILQKVTLLTQELEDAISKFDVENN